MHTRNIRIKFIELTEKFTLTVTTFHNDNIDIFCVFRESGTVVVSPFLLLCSYRVNGDSWWLVYDKRHSC